MKFNSFDFAHSLISPFIFPFKQTITLVRSDTTSNLVEHIKTEEQNEKHWLRNKNENYSSKRIKPTQTNITYGGTKTLNAVLCKVGIVFPKKKKKRSPHISLHIGGIKVSQRWREPS